MSVEAATRRAHARAVELGSLGRAAREAGVNRETLRHRCEKLGLPPAWDRHSSRMATTQPERRAASAPRASSRRCSCARSMATSMDAMAYATVGGVPELLDALKDVQADLDNERSGSEEE